MQQQRHRWLRLCIRLMLPIFVLAGLGSLSSLFLIGMTWEKEVAHADSPTHVYRASVLRISGNGACGPAGGLAVQVARHYFALKTGEDIPFCLHGAGEIKVHWRDGQTLAIDCRRCEHYDVSSEDWEHLHYAFDLDQP